MLSHSSQLLLLGVELPVHCSKCLFNYGHSRRSSGLGGGCLGGGSGHSNRGALGVHDVSHHSERGEGV